MAVDQRHNRLNLTNRPPSDMTKAKPTVQEIDHPRPVWQ